MKYYKKFVGGLIRVAPGLVIVVTFIAVFCSDNYRALPPESQLVMAKIFFPVVGILVAHWLGKCLLPTVRDWSRADQPFVKIARISFYVAICLSIALGG